MIAKENEKFLLGLCMIIGLTFILIVISNIIQNNRITDLEEKIEELEQQELQVHEYILNRIGG